MSERTASLSTGGEGSTGANTPAEAGNGSRAPLGSGPASSASGSANEAGSGSVVRPKRPSRRASTPSGKAPRRARLRLTRIDPWTVMKTSFLLSIAFGIVTVVAVFMVWSVLGAAGVWDSINSTVASVVEADAEGSKFDVTDYLGTGRVLGFTLLVSVIDVILLTAIATLTAFIYNMAAALLGGIEVTLAEDQR